MTLYNVHIYREMRLFFPGIEAATPDEAARIAAEKPTADADYTEDCDGDNLAALVDVVGDDEFEHSVTIDFDHERVRKAAPALMEALEYVLDCLESFKPDWLFNVGLDRAAEKARAAVAAVATTHNQTIERTIP